MVNAASLKGSALFVLLAVAGCGVLPTGNQFVLLGESTIPGTQAVAEANIRVANANAAGCRAVSVGGYGLGRGGEGSGTLVGVPVLVSCPSTVRLLPNGTAAP